MADIEPIYDRYGEIGPAAAILSAMDEKPGCAWLVLAVDMPLLDELTLQQLVEERDPAKKATAYISSTAGHEGLPEPLCAIYEPGMRDDLYKFVREQDIRCPRCILIELKKDSHFIPLKNQKALTNVNTPEEFDRARKRGF